MTNRAPPSALLRWRHCALALVPLALLIAFIWRAATESNAREAEKRAANAATRLPAGIRESWFTLVDQKLGDRLIAADGLIKFAEAGGYVTWVPAQLVTVNCSPQIGIWLSYSTSNIGPEVSLVQPRESPSFGSGIGAMSPAAGNLLAEVCKRVTLAVRRVIEFP
jgi:hypothetical protein